MNSLSEKLLKVEHEIVLIQHRHNLNEVYGIQMALEKIHDLLGDIVKEIENLKTVDNNSHQ